MCVFYFTVVLYMPSIDVFFMTEVGLMSSVPAADTHL